MLLCSLLLGSAPLLANRQAVQESVASGAHFRVTVHFKDDRVAKEALEAAESAWPFATAMLGAPTIESDKPLEVHLYKTVEDYEKADQEFGGGNFKANLCFTSFATKTAYIMFRPDVSDAVRAHTGLTTLTRGLVAHEATHVICDHTWGNAPTLPSWFAEGCATWVCQQAMTKNTWITSPGDDPTISTDDANVKRLEADKKLPAFAVIFDDLLGDMTLDDRYAVWQCAFRFLHDGKHSAALTKIIAAAQQAGGGPNHGAAIAAAAREALGGDKGLAACDKEFAAYVHALTPRWQQVYQSLSTIGDAWVQTATTEHNAIAWRTADVGSERYEVSGELEVFDGDQRQMNLLLGRTPNGFVQLALTAGSGVVVFEYDNRRLNGKDWKRVGSVDLPDFKVDHSTPFRVKVAKSKLSIDVDGKNVGSFDVGDHPMQGACGLGALAGSAGAWRKFIVKKS